MSDQPTLSATPVKFPDPAAAQKALADIFMNAVEVTRAVSQKAVTPPDALGVDPMNTTKALFDFGRSLLSQPTVIANAQLKAWNDWSALWTSTLSKMAGKEEAALVEPAKGDRRFSDPAWTAEVFFDHLKQAYLLAGNHLTDLVDSVENVDADTQVRVRFLVRQYLDAVAPTNFAATNPAAIRKTLETGGVNLLAGLANLLADAASGRGLVQRRSADPWELGVNIAATPGSIVFQNALFQLIQYEPSTKKVARRPLLYVPPLVNKYYLMDLQPKSSLLKWLVDQGHTVFVISWVNPDESLAAKSFEDYMLEGTLASLDAIEKATGEKQADVIGYCLGGTLLACTLSYLAAKKQDSRVASATFFTTMTDFKEPGELGVFIDEEQLAALEDKMALHGYLDGRDMATTFNMMRANDLIWSFVVNNYLLGKDPFPFDLLYWNSDSTRMPAAMHSFYLRKMYQENKLIEVGGIELNGVKIDLAAIKTPIYMLATREDHIAPWASTYALTQHVSGPVKFVLSASGHIAGVVNPPAANKYCYWTNTKKPKTPDAWLASATEEAGSWWTDWQKWVEKFAGKQVPVRQPGAGKLKVIEDAPGAYVKNRLT